MRARMAGVSEILAGERSARDRHAASAFDGNGLGYGWPATFQLLLPPKGKPVNARQILKMVICPACSAVHESGGGCISRRTPATADAANS